MFFILGFFVVVVVALSVVILVLFVFNSTLGIIRGFQSVPARSGK